MPYSRDVDSYAEAYFKIAALMRTNKSFHTGWMEVHLAKRLRYTWLAFVRAHYSTIERTNASISSLRLSAKDPLSSERVAPARNMLMTNRAREARLDVIRKFETSIEIDLLSDEPRARLHFKEKSLVLASAGIDELFAALPASQQRFEEEIQAELESPAPRAFNVVAAPEADLSEFFSMPMEEKIRLGIAAPPDNASPASPFAGNASQAPAQLDSGPARAYPTLAIGGERTDVPDAPQVSDPLTKEE